MSKNIAIIFAGGSGARMGTGVPKQFIEIEGKPIIIYTLENFEDHEEIDEIYVSCIPSYIEKLEKLVKVYMISKVVKIVPGGDTGQESIYNALKAAYENNSAEDIVLLHDGVRPHITNELISENIASVKNYGSAITCSEMFETPVVSKDKQIVDNTPHRHELFTAQAPQSFYLGDIIGAHESVRETNPDYVGLIDSCMLMKSLGKEVYMVKGNRGNIKVTTPEDLYLLRGLIQYRETTQAFGITENEMPKILKK